MAETARVESIAELRAFRVALLKFVDACNVALGDAESDMQRTNTWLERDQLSYWNAQLAKRAEAVSRAKEAVRMKKLFKSPTGATQTAVEEEKALRVAIRLHEEAEQKITACRQWAKRLQKEIMLYKGGVTRFASVLGGDIPRALAKLDAMAASLEQYAALSAGSAGGSAGGIAAGASLSETMASMSRPVGQNIEGQSSLDIAALRESVPPADIRVSAIAADLREETWALPPIRAASRKALVEITSSPLQVSDEQTLIVASGAWSAPRIYFERRVPAEPDDSGWYLASTLQAGIPALYKVRVRDLLEIRPDFREILSLPASFLVVIDQDGVRSVFNPAGDDLWAEKSRL